MPTLDELGWLAGIIDGEGTIGLYRQRKDINSRVVPTLFIPNTNPAIIEKAHRILADIVGDGSVRIMTIKKRQSHHRVAWRVGITTRLGLYKVFDAVIPFLSGKAALAELVKQWCERRLVKGPGKYLTLEDQALTEKFDRLRASIKNAT